jgi:nucleoside-diphosphate-sugar epimerase
MIMKVFLAGGSGAIGKRLVPQLLGRGHSVVAMTRSERNAERLRQIGAEAAIADGLDRGAVMQAVMRSEPEVVVHELTGLTGLTSYKDFDKEFALTNRLRTEGTDHLLEAAQAAGARRFVAQSYGNWIYERTGDALKTEEDPLDPKVPAKQSRSLEAIKYLESRVVGAEGLEGLALRYGSFYGPGTGIEVGGELAEMIHRRRFPIVGDGGGVWTWIHIDDAASATVAAVERGAPGVYNIVDDEPTPVSQWLPALAQALGAKPPRHVPVWLGRIAAGEVGVSMMTQVRGSSNAKAKRELGWEPRYRSYREGFTTGLADAGGSGPTGVSSTPEGRAASRDSA